MAGKPTISTTFNAVDKMTAPMKNMRQSVTRFAVGAGVAIGAAAAGIGRLVQEASKIEDAVAGFTPLLGGVEKANELVAQLNQTAATTPFQFENISAAAKQLLPVMNQDIERTVDTFRMLGDTAGGNAQALDSITRGYSKAMLKGKVDMEALNMIGDQGVPIFSELAATLGVTVAEMMDMSSAGEIASSDLEDAFRNMTSEGGIFFNGMNIASQTFSGKMSTLKDNIGQTAGALGTTLLPTIKPIVDKFNDIAISVKEWVNNNGDLIKQKIQGFIAGITKTAKTLYKLWDNGLIPAIAAGVITFIAITKAIKTYQAVLATVKAIQIAFNIAAGANPIGLIIIGVAALVAVIVLFIKNFDRIKEVARAVWEAVSGFFVKIGESIVGISGKIKEVAVGAWDTIKDYFGRIRDFILNIWEKIKSPFEAIGSFFKASLSGPAPGISSAEGRGAGSSAGYPGMVSGNSGMISSQTTTVNRSTVDINMAGLPNGSSVRQSGVAPGVTLNYGYGGSGL